LDVMSAKLTRNRGPNVRLVAGLLVGMSLVALALLRTGPSDIPEARVTRLLRVEGEHAGSSEDAQAFSRKDAAATGSWRVEFRIQVPSKSRIWLTDEDIGIEIPGVHGDWTRVAAPGGKSPTPHSLQRTISRTTWFALPAGVKRCRLTIGFRRETLQEHCMRLLDESGASGRFPKTSDWIVKHLPSTRQWRVCRRELQLMAIPEPNLNGITIL